MSRAHTVMFYAAVKDNEVLPFAEKQSELEIIVVNEISKNQKDVFFSRAEFKYFKINTCYEGRTGPTGGSSLKG